MAFTAVIVATIPHLLTLLCPECDGNGAWHIPDMTWYALIYWVLIQSVTAYLLVTWANRYADPSVNCAYAVLQPMTAAVASYLLMLTPQISDCSDNEKTMCLYGPSIGDFGSIGICLGLGCV